MARRDPRRAGPGRRGVALSRIGAALLAAAALVAALAGCAPSLDTAVAQPAAGECRLLDRPEQFRALSDGTPTVACDQEHTAETYLVGELDRETYPVLGEREAIAAEACPPGVVRGYLGAHQRQALYGVWTVPWLPSEQQWAEGERWVRCDLVTVLDESAAFDPLVHTASLRGAAGDAARADALTRCYAAVGEVADPVLSAPDETLDVRCDQPHGYRDVNHWLRQETAPGAGTAIRDCAESVQEWIGLGLRGSAGVAGVLREEANGNLTLRCVSVGADDAA